MQISAGLVLGLLSGAITFFALLIADMKKDRYAHISPYSCNWRTFTLRATIFTGLACSAVGYLIAGEHGLVGAATGAGVVVLFMACDKWLKGDSGWVAIATAVVLVLVNAFPA